MGNNFMSNTLIAKVTKATPRYLFNITPIPSVTYKVQSLDSDCVVTFGNCRQHSDYILDLL